MFRDVLVWQEVDRFDEPEGTPTLVRVEGDPDTTEISDVIAMRLAYEHVMGHPANDVVVARYCECVSPVVIGLDGQPKLTATARLRR